MVIQGIALRAARVCHALFHDRGQATSPPSGDCVGGTPFPPHGLSRATRPVDLVLRAVEPVTIKTNAFIKLTLSAWWQQACQLCLVVAQYTTKRILLIWR